MKMAKASKQDIDAAGDAMSILIAIDRGDYPKAEGQENVPDWFDEDDPEHLRRFYDAMKATLDAGPGWPGRVIGGMCYVILYEKNEIIDHDSDVIELHPRLVAMEKDAERYRWLRDTGSFPAAVWEALEGFGSDTSEGYGKGMDEAIDAAMAATQPSKEE